VLGSPSPRVAVTVCRSREGGHLWRETPELAGPVLIPPRTTAMNSSRAKRTKRGVLKGQGLRPLW
jgi:hypothetical protein